ncbi:MAG: HAD family hydrolase, partial [Sutterella sp.]
MSSTLFRPIPSTGQLPRVCVFDLDHTLIAGDATVDWTRYLLEEKLVTDPRFLEVDRLMEERYIAGTLLLEDYLREIIPFFSYLSMDELAVHGERFMARYIAPTVYQEGLDAIAEARRLGMD